MKHEYLLTSRRSKKFEQEMTDALLYTRRLHSAMLYYNKRNANGSIPADKKRRYNKELELQEHCMVGSGVQLNLTYPDSAAARMCNKHKIIDIDDYSMVVVMFNNYN